MAAQDSPVFRAGTNTVLVPVTVTDRSGRFVQGLTAEQFEISEGGTRRAVAEFSAGRVPVSLGILLDISGAMAPDEETRVADGVRWAHTRRALEVLLTRLDAADEVSFAVFNHQVAVAPWTQDHPGILREFDGLRPGGGNALLDAVQLVSPTFELARHQRKVLLLISDGNDTNSSSGQGATPSDPRSLDGAPPGHEPMTLMADSRETLRQRRISTAKSILRRLDVMLYAIGIGTRKGMPVDTVLLEGLTRDSGGYAEPLRDPSAISAAAARIWDDLQSQYLLAFEPGSVDGRYHEIRVRTKDRQLRVRSRAGYVALPVTPK